MELAAQSLVSWGLLIKVGSSEEIMKTKSPPIGKKVSDLFEGPNSSLRRTYEKVVAPKTRAKVLPDSRLAGQGSALENQLHTEVATPSREK